MLHFVASFLHTHCPRFPRCFLPSNGNTAIRELFPLFPLFPRETTPGKNGVESAYSLIPGAYAPRVAHNERILFQDGDLRRA